MSIGVQRTTCGRLRPEGSVAGARSAARSALRAAGARLPTLAYHVETYPCPPASVMLITHVLDTAVPFIDAVARAAHLSSVVAIPYSAQPTACAAVRERARIALPADMDALHEQIRDELAQLGDTARHPVVVQEIGGYCSSMLDDLVALDRFAGIVEDTKQGHWSYAAMDSLPCPVLSIAESPLKALENQQVGRSIAYALDAILRRRFHRLASDLRIGILGFGGVGEATARALTALGARIAVYDVCDIRMAKAAMDGLMTCERDVLLSECDVVLGVSGARSIEGDDLGKLRDGAIIASGSSKQVEIDVAALTERGRLTASDPPAKRYALGRGHVFLLNDGMPINFLEQSILGTVLDLVYSELYMCVRELALGRREAGLGALELSQQRRIAEAWRMIHWKGSRT